MLYNDSSDTSAHIKITNTFGYNIESIGTMAGQI